MSKFLLIQTAFIGDVILATPVIEKLHNQYPGARIDFLLRKGNEDLLNGHPYLHKIYVWDKKGNKYANLLAILKEVKEVQYEYVINLQRFFSTGLFTVLARAKTTIGFSKNPLSFLFDKKVSHIIRDGIHEVGRNIALIKDITDAGFQRPVLYPSPDDFERVQAYKKMLYVCFAPASIWYTKQLPIDQWIALAKSIASNYKLIFLGASGDREFCDQIIKTVGKDNTVNLCGELTMLQSAALMKDAKMNYVNDSAPLHLASSINAPATAFFCSTIPAFGFGPLSDQSKVAQIDYKLECRPCSLHGKKVCPEGHFKCGHDINLKNILV
jgi:heptosyltransferase-2